MSKVTMSHHCGSHSNIGSAMATMRHSFDKDFRAKEDHIDKDQSKKNIILKYENLKDAYEQEFGESVKKYNEKQIENGHPERQIDDYLKKISDDKQKNVLYEHIIQFGDRNSIGVGRESNDHIEAMREFVAGWNERNPNMHLVGAVIHRDEISGTDHGHLFYFPVAKDMTRGLEVQNGYKQALKQMGFETKAKERTAQIQWEKSEKQELERIGRNHGLEIEHKHGNREHFQQDVYKAYAEKENAEKELKDTREDLQNNRNALDNIERDLQKSRDEIEQLANLKRDMPTLPPPDGTGFKKGWYSPQLVKQIQDNNRADWLQERQEKHEYKERADKAERKLDSFGDVEPHQLHDPDFLRQRANEIEKTEREQRETHEREYQPTHEHSRSSQTVEIGGR